MRRTTAEFLRGLACAVPLLALAGLKVGAPAASDVRVLPDRVLALVTGIEVGLGSLFALGWQRRRAAAGLLLLAVTFIVWTVARGPELFDGLRSCGCFGRIRSTFAMHLLVGGGLAVLGGARLAATGRLDGDAPAKPGA